MAGLVPAIHAAPLSESFNQRSGGSAWMPGTRPGMTPAGCTELQYRNQFDSIGKHYDQ
jgi:hypothetical protein